MSVRQLQLCLIRCASRPNKASFISTELTSLRRNATKNIHTSSKVFCLADGGGGFHKPTPFQRKVLVWTKVYPNDADIPDRITRSQMKNSMDKFRVRVSIGMVAMTFIFAAMMALVGRKARNEGQSITKISMARRHD